MPPPPDAAIEHQLPGRTRLRIRGPGLGPHFFGDLESRLRGLPGVREVRTNWRTGGVLVAHEGAVDPILVHARDQGLFEVRTRRVAASGVAAASPAAAAAHAAGVWRTRSRGADPRSLAACGLAGLALYQAGRGQTLGNAAELFWQAFTLGSARHHPVVAVGFAGLGAWQFARGRVLGPATSLLSYALTARRLTGPPEP